MESIAAKELEKKGESLDLEAVLRIITPATACNYSGFIQSNLNASRSAHHIMHRGTRVTR